MSYTRRIVHSSCSKGGMSSAPYLGIRDLHSLTLYVKVDVEMSREGSETWVVYKPDLFC